MNFNHRVEEFMKTIILNKNGPFNVQHYNYRVEFQLRGAAHIHGTLWIDFERLILPMNRLVPEENKKIQERKAKYPNDKLIQSIEEKEIKTAETYYELFKKIKDEEFGMELQENKDDDKKHLKALVEFTDWFATCSLKDPSTRQIVLDVNQHKHFNQSCRKNGPNCKYNFPRFPCLETIIAIPSRIKYKGDEETEKKELEKSRNILNKNRYLFVAAIRLDLHTIY